MTELGISEFYEPLVIDALTMKNVPKFFPLSLESPRFELANDMETGRKKLLIEVFSYTKQKDFNKEEFLENLKKHQAKLHDFGSIKQVGSPNLDIAEQIVNLHFEEGKSYKELKKLFPTVKDIGTVIKRYKKRMGIRTRKRQK
jgi:hypothetical protein